MNTRQAEKIIKNHRSGAVNYKPGQLRAARAHLANKPHIDQIPEPEPIELEIEVAKEEFDFTDGDYGRKSTIAWMKTQLGDEIWESDWRKRDFIVAMITKELPPHPDDQ